MVHLSQPGVFALVHYRTKAMYISYSNNMLTAISNHIFRAKNGTHECSSLNKQFKNLRLYVLEYSNNPKERCAYWYTHYSNQGNKLYNSKVPVQYKARIEVGSDYLVYVKIVTKRNDSFVIGVFNSMTEAQEFYNIVISQEQIVPIYANNELTRKYVEVQ